MILIVMSIFVIIGFVFWEKAISADNNGQHFVGYRLQKIANASLSIGLIFMIVYFIQYWQGV
jgi:peptidoglycan/LPS O-acetylase OafA/YrhL